MVRDYIGLSCWIATCRYPRKSLVHNNWHSNCRTYVAGGWGFFHVAKSFFWAVQSINRSLGGKLFANLKRGKVRSLQKLGSTNQVNGFIHRPRVPQQEQMVRVLESYFKAHGRYAGLHTWPVINVANLEDESFWAGLKIAEQ